jgi:NAD(P)-dependent dehydrogenase (short-subunit alcohol dehydrogenase family)
MNQPLRGHSALITGGAGGFGKACAIALARDGAAVTLMGRNAGALATSSDEVAHAVPDARMAIHPGDAAVEADVIAAVAATIAHGGGIDIVVGTVGGGKAFGPLLEQNHAMFMADLALNVGSAFLAVRHAGPHMRAGGNFVFISSTAAEMPFPGMTSYCTAKAALDHFVRAAANDLGALGLRVNAVRPGLTRTGATTRLFQNPEIMQGFLATIPLGRPGEPVDIAQAVRFLAGPEASWVTGQSFAVDGGNELRGAPLSKP